MTARFHPVSPNTWSPRYEDLSAGAHEATKKSLLDAVGVSLGANGLGRRPRPRQQFLSSLRLYIQKRKEAIQ